MKYDDDESNRTENVYMKCRFDANMYWMNPADPGWASNNKQMCIRDSYYTKLTTALFEDYLFDLCYNISGTNERKFVALTGEMGIREFDRILKEKAASFNMIDTHFVTGSGQDLKLGGQFTTYTMTNGCLLYTSRFV